MEYEGQICRAPMERGAFMLPVSVGCCYNRCKFCTLFKHLSYRILPISQVEAELHRVRDMGGNPKTVFLGDGSAFQLPYDHLVEILTRIRSRTKSWKLSSTVSSRSSVSSLASCKFSSS